MSDEKLKAQSEKFYAFEWLRGEALKGNRLAEVMLREVARLNRPQPNRLTVRSVKRLHVKPGEVLVVSVPRRHCGMERLKRIETSLRKIMPAGVRVLVMNEDFKCHVVTATAGHQRNPGDGQ